MDESLRVSDNVRFADIIGFENFSKPDINIDEVAQRWLTGDGRYLILCSSLDDSNQHTQVSLVFSDKGGEIASFKMQIESIIKKYPALRAISELVIDAPAWEESDTSLEVDDIELEAIADSLGSKFHPELQENIIPFHNLIEYCMMYAIDNVADVSMSLADKRFLYDDLEIEDPYLRDNRIVSVCLNYTEPNEKGRGFGEFLYSVIPSN